MNRLTKAHIAKVNEWVYQCAKRIIESGDEHDPLLFAIDIDDGDNFKLKHAENVGRYMNPNGGKEVLSATMRELVADGACDAVVLVSEAWAVKVENPKIKVGGDTPLTSRELTGYDSCAENPARTEVLLVSIIYDGGHIAITHPIHRNPNRLQRGEPLPSGGVGRFTDRDTYPPQQPEWAREMVARIKSGEDV